MIYGRVYEATDYLLDQLIKPEQKGQQSSLNSMQESKSELFTAEELCNRKATER